MEMGGNQLAYNFILNKYRIIKNYFLMALRKILKI